MNRTRRLATLLVTVSVLVGSATAAPALAAIRASHVSATIDSTTVALHGSLLVSGSATPAVAGLAVSVQRLEGTRWLTVGHAKESPRGSWSVPLRAPGTAGLTQLRVVRARTASVKAGVSRTLRLHVVRTSFTVSAHAASPVPGGRRLVVTGRVSPATTGSVVLEQLHGSVWTALVSERLIASGYTFSNLRVAGSYALRVVKAATPTVARGVSPTVEVTVQPAATSPQPPALAVTTTALPAGTTHSAYSATLTATGGTGPYTWQITAGALPGGLSLSTAGAIAGTPTAAGVRQLTVEVTSGGVSASNTLSIAISQAVGSLESWGGNGSGELGDGLPTGALVPTQVSGLSGVARVASLGDNSLALTSNGSVLAWGDGSSGQLGNDSSASSATPVQVTGLTSGVSAIAVGGQSGYALKSDGTVWAWGDGSYGQLGDGLHTGSQVPVKVTGIASVVAIAADDTGAVALESDGTVWRWGEEFAATGHGDDNASATPILVDGLSDASAIAVGAGTNDAFAVMADHSVRAWGASSGTEFAWAVPGLANVTAVTGGDATGYALESDGTVWSWGSGDRGQLGNGGKSSTGTAVKVVGVTGAVAIGAGGSSAYAVLANHSLDSWGANDHGQLGNGTTVDSLIPRGVSGVGPVAGVAGDGVAVDSDGTVWAWGPDPVAFTNRAVVAPVAGITDAVSVAQDDEGGMAIRSDGTLWTWGDNTYGELGNGSLAPRSDTPVRVSGLTQVVAVTGKQGERLAVTEDGSVWAWGANSSGVFGSTLPLQSNVPLKVPGLSQVTSVAAGAGSGFALRSDGTLWAWGDNTFGALGDGTEVDRSTPRQVPGLPTVTAVASGLWDVVALTSTGSVWAWGDGFEDQLGQGAPVQSFSPLLVPGLAGVTAVATQGGTSYALLGDGSVVYWGVSPFWQFNQSGQLYDGAPQHVPGVVGATAVATGEDSGYALLGDGSVMAWGLGTFGQIGNGSFDAFSTHGVPVPVPALRNVIGISAGGSSALALSTGTG